MYKWMSTFLKNRNFIAAVIIIAGLIMDIGVNITNVFLIAVTESYMDYIYSAIITIAILSFTIITLISGMLDNNYYGYRLKEIIQFKDSPVNFKEYIYWSFGSIFLATCLLAADFNISCVNGLTMLLFAVIYLE